MANSDLICEQIADLLVDYFERNGLEGGGGVTVESDGAIVIDYVAYPKEEEQ